MHAAMKHESYASGLMLKHMRGAEQMAAHYASFAHWDWLTMAVKSVKGFANLEELYRIGFNLDSEGSSHLPDAAAYENSLAEIYKKILFQILRFRSSSQLFYVASSGATAGLLHIQKQASSLQFWQKIDQTINTVEARGSLRAKELLKDHPLTGRIETWVRKALSAVQFEYIPEILHKYLVDAWGGLHNTKLVEDLNRVLREHERKRDSNEVSPALGWHALSNREVLKSYDRQECTVSALSHVPQELAKNAQSLFSRKQARFGEVDPDDEKVQKLVSDITGPKTWTSNTPASEQEHHANLALLQKCVEQDDFALVESAWHSGLLPEGTCVLIGDNEIPSLVIRTFRLGALCWPMRYGPHSTVEFDESVTCLYWLFAHTLDIKVLKLEAWSPLQMLRKGDRRNAGICLGFIAAENIVDYHANHGFSGLKEPLLVQLAAQCGWGEGPRCETMDAESVWAVHCMLHVDPSLTQQEVCSRVLARSELDEINNETCTMIVSFCFFVLLTLLFSDNNGF